MKLTRITSVNIVTNHLFIYNHWRHNHTVHEGHKDYKCESCEKSFAGAQYLKKHIHTIHRGQKV